MSFNFQGYHQWVSGFPSFQQTRGSHGSQGFWHFWGSGSQGYQSISLNLMILRIKKFFGVPTIFDFLEFLGFSRFLGFSGVIKNLAVFSRVF